jgi:hypothetical protein
MPFWWAIFFGNATLGGPQRTTEFSEGRDAMDELKDRAAGIPIYTYSSAQVGNQEEPMAELTRKVDEARLPGFELCFLDLPNTLTPEQIAMTKTKLRDTRRAVNYKVSCESNSGLKCAQPRGAGHALGCHETRCDCLCRGTAVTGLPNGATTCARSNCSFTLRRGVQLERLVQVLRLG